MAHAAADPRQGIPGRRLHRSCGKTQTAPNERGVTNISQILEYLQQRIREHGLSLAEALRHLQRLIEDKSAAEENSDLLRLESEENAVQLMTMHSSKGLEFPVVFIFGVSNQYPPIWKKHMLKEIMQS